MQEYIDIGVNLTSSSLMQDIEGVLQRAGHKGVKRLVVTGSNLTDSATAIALCKRYPEQLVCTTGVHPHHASEWQDDSSAALQQLSKHACVRAIGETGLDFNRNHSSRNAQIDAFSAQLDCACQVRKPVFTHQRDAHDDFIRVVREFRHRLPKIVVHCFTDNQSALSDYLELDCHIGITGWICDERRGTSLQKLVQYIPRNRLMLETDAPYLLPRDLKPKPRSRINEPAYLPHIAQAIANHQNKTLPTLAAECLKTTRAFFDI